MTIGDRKRFACERTWHSHTYLGMISKSTIFPRPFSPFGWSSCDNNENVQIKKQNQIFVLSFSIVGSADEELERMRKSHSKYSMRKNWPTYSSWRSTSYSQQYNISTISVWFSHSTCERRAFYLQDLLIFAVAFCNMTSANMSSTSEYCSTGKYNLFAGDITSTTMVKMAKIGSQDAVHSFQRHNHGHHRCCSASATKVNK